MEIFISDKRLRKVIDDDAACRRQYGVDMAKKIALRLAAPACRGFAGRFLAAEVGAGTLP